MDTLHTWSSGFSTTRRKVRSIVVWNRRYVSEQSLLYINAILTREGIHGRPYRPWGGVQGDNPAGWQGYCTHSSILFAPWHRPYLALFEVSAYFTYDIVSNTNTIDSNTCIKSSKRLLPRFPQPLRPVINKLL